MNYAIITLADSPEQPILVRNCHVAHDALGWWAFTLSNGNYTLANPRFIAFVQEIDEKAYQTKVDEQDEYAKSFCGATPPIRPWHQDDAT